MDDPGRRKRHNETPAHNAANPRYSFQDPSQQSRPLANNADERYRPAPLNPSPSTPRGLGTAGSYSSYYQEPTAAFATTNMSASTMGYGSDYSHDARQQQQQQGQSFGSYNAANLMYNVAQPNPQTPVYDAQQFGQRQPSSMQMLPDVASAYFTPEAGTGSASSLQPSAQSTGTSVYQQTPSISYSSNLPASSAIHQTPGGADVSMGEDHDYADGALEEKWVNYQRQLGTVFQDIANGSLESASETLLSISSWLLSQVADLGIDRPPCTGTTGSTTNQ